MVAGKILRGQRAFLVVAASYVGFGVAAQLAGYPVRIALYNVPAIGGLLVLACAFLLWRLFLLIRSGSRGRPTVLLYHDVRQQITVERLLWAFPAILLIPPVISIYTSFKCMIDEFTWDATLAEWDRILHGGDPWYLLQPLIGDTWISHALGRVYSFWFVAIQVIVAWQAFARGPARQQFLISWVICWGVLGTVGAHLFASAGPVFYGRLYGELDDPFAAIAPYVHKLSVWDYQWQDWLWAAYERRELAALGKGISAMPSLHVAVATLNALVAWRHDRRFGVAMAVYAALVALASVHLGWHYAVDTYAGALAAIVIWFMVGAAFKLARASGPLPAAIG